MSVYPVTHVIGTSTESWEDAASVAVKTASQTLRELRVAEVVAQASTWERTGASPTEPRFASRSVVRPRFGRPGPGHRSVPSCTRSGARVVGVRDGVGTHPDEDLDAVLHPLEAQVRGGGLEDQVEAELVFAGVPVARLQKMLGGLLGEVVAALSERQLGDQTNPWTTSPPTAPPPSHLSTTRPADAYCAHPELRSCMCRMPDMGAEHVVPGQTVPGTDVTGQQTDDRLDHAEAM
jgi:flavin-binding protein dodecin